MTRIRLSPLVACLAVLLGSAPRCPAQAPLPAEELLRYVPKDFSLCLVVNDLRGYAAKWGNSPFMNALKESSLGHALLDAPEFKDLVKFQQDLHKHFDIDWPTLRDEVIGDAVVYAYRPGKADDEQGMLLMHAHKPDILGKLLDNLNKAQTASGELKALEARDHKGAKYHCRVEPGGNHFYVLNGPFFAYTGRETLMQTVLDEKRQAQLITKAKRPIGPRIKTPDPIGAEKGLPVKDPPLNAMIDHLRRAGAANATASLWINPRSFDTDLKDRAADFQGAGMFFLQTLAKHWPAFDGVVVSYTADKQLELKVSVVARGKDLTGSARDYFMEPARAADVLARFPDNALVAMAGRTDFAALAESSSAFLAPEVRKLWQRVVEPIATLAGLDLAKEVAPNVGPDWGVCVLPAKDPRALPQVLAALAVRPGADDVDQNLYRGTLGFASLSLFDYNRHHETDPIRLRTQRRDNVEVKYLVHDKVFPQGVQPACALKDGYLLVATSPEAISRFRLGAGSTGQRAEAPLLRIASKDLANAVRDHRQWAIDQLAARNQLTPMEAGQTLDDTLSMLDLFERLEVARSGGAGQANFVVRLSPR